MSYSVEEHKHRYAAWASSRASSVKGCRFSVLQGKMLLEKLNLNSLVNRPDLLPVPGDMDRAHERWRDELITEAEGMGLLFSHGVAAKLINMYFKTIFVCGGYDSNKNVHLLHPPIDAVLLKALRIKNVGGFKVEWRAAEKAKWSKFTSEEYVSVIDCIKKHMGSKPLWEIEEYWQGFQK